MLSLSLDIDLESFSPLVNGPLNDGQFAVSRDLNYVVNRLLRVLDRLAGGHLLTQTLPSVGHSPRQAPPLTQRPSKYNVLSHPGNAVQQICPAR